MTTPLVESIPNYSEGRRLDVVEQIAAEILSVSNVNILDRHSDADHNRTVITLLGSPQAVSEALFKSIAKAAELIDMDSQQGEHPRIGATDVVPFVPVRDISMKECVELARELGKRVGDELGIPVYLYEEAAVVPERTNLENIRKGQYEGLKAEVETDPLRKPDFGPSRLGKAGATVVGAREALIAFNVYLNTDDVEIAKSIAKTIRFSSGGLRFVKAMGVLVEGRAQVSMNLTNYRKTPIALVVETIRREAQRYAAAIHHCELVGLVPQEALVDTAVWYTQLDQFESSQVLENRLTAAAQVGSSQHAFLDDLASDQPTPGGGSAAAFSAAEAAALVTMVGRVTLGKKKYESVEAEVKEIIAKSEILRNQLTRAIDEDAASFDRLMAAFRLPKETQEQVETRSRAIHQASLGAAAVPLQTANSTLEVMKLAERMVSIGNMNAITDAGTAGALCKAAVAAAGANVRINLSGMDADKEAGVMLGEIKDIEKNASKIYSALQDHIKERAGIELL
ncbi:MAG: glutamate formimidoyltransferase [Chloroflexi bacterium]|nr:glutamate formimidoyltransferase [Chloroflexota bacterium]